MTLLAPLRGVLGPLGVALASPLAALRNGLVASWRLDENSGTIAADATGNSHTGTWSGTLVGQWGTGKIGSCASVDGSTRRVTVADAPDLTPGATGISVSAWYKGTATNGQIAGKWGSSTEYTLYINGGGGANQAVFFVNTGVIGFASSGVPVNDGVWHHLVGTWDGANICIYTDGVLRSTTAKTGTVSDTSVTFTIGAESSNLNGAAGLIDEVNVWSRALSQSDVNALYNAGSGVQP